MRNEVPIFLKKAEDYTALFEIKATLTNRARKSTRSAAGARPFACRAELPQEERSSRSLPETFSGYRRVG